MSELFMEPGEVHSAELFENPGLCPRCLEREITGRKDGGKVQLIGRDGKWVCPRAGKSYAQQLGTDGINAAGFVDMGFPLF